MSHEAAILNSKGSPLVITTRPTAAPGNEEVVIAVTFVALNPVDHIQQTMGFNISSFPYILGFDVSGTIIAVGSSVSGLAVGDRVLANASSWFSKNMDHGAFQQYVIVPTAAVTKLPDSIPLDEAAMLPLAVYTAWYGMLVNGIPRDTKYQLSDNKGILIWGVGGSVGSVTLQVAKSMGYHIYATASAKHHAYLQTLGGGPGKVTLFDYHDADVVTKIVQAIKKDGIIVDLGYEAAAGNLSDMISILNQTKGGNNGWGNYAKIASAPFSVAMLWHNKLCPSFFSGVQVKFVAPPNDQEELRRDLSFMYNTWLPNALASGDLVPSPRVQKAPNGLRGIQAGMDELKKQAHGGVKIVLEL